MAFDAGEVDLQAKVTVRMNGQRVETTPGRVVLYETTPKELGFEAVNKVINKKEVKNLISLSYRQAGIKKTVIFADRLKDIGYKFATRSGLSICIGDMEIPPEKEDILNAAMNEVKEVDQQYREGLITDGEKYNKVVDIWARATEEVTERMMERMGIQEFRPLEGSGNGGEKDSREAIVGDSFNPIYMMADSGSRGSKDQIRQLAGMRGLMAKPSGEIIETPIMANFREGLTVLQYFTSTHGARKGLADTALKTAGSGYLTRRLVDVAQDCIIMEEDCGTLDGVWIEHLREGGEIIQRLGERVLGRVALMDVRDPVSGDILVEANQEIDENGVIRIEEAGLDKILIRSALTCKTKQGVCAKCYGRDLAHGKAVDIGESVGIVAAQSIGEPGTQLTMRTFHIGGTASRRVEQSTILARREARGQIRKPGHGHQQGRRDRGPQPQRQPGPDRGRVDPGTLPDQPGYHPQGQGRGFGQGGPAHRRVGPLHRPAPDRRVRPGELHRHRGRPDHAGEAGPGDRSFDQGHRRFPGRRGPAPRSWWSTRSTSP